MATTAPRKMVSVIHITDYAKWLASFSGFEAQRESQGGLRNPQILRGVTDPNFVAILFDVDDGAKAPAYMASPPLRAATESGGVVGAPTIFFP
jgi:hypothetical protein